MARTSRGKPRAELTEEEKRMLGVAPVVQGTQARTREQAQSSGLIGGQYAPKSPRAKGWWDEIMSDPFTALFAGTDGLDRKYEAQQAEQEAARMAPQQAWMDNYIASLPPEQRALAQGNFKSYSEEMSKNYAPQNVNTGDTLVMRGDTANPMVAPKFGFEGSTPYAQTYQGGQMQTNYGAPRPKSYTEATQEGTLSETGRHNRAMEGVANGRLAFDKTKPSAAGGLTPYQGLNFQFKLDDLDRDLTEKEKIRKSNLATVGDSLALLKQFTDQSTPEAKARFDDVYGNWINPTGKENDLLNWRVAAGSPRANGMAILEQLGGSAFLDAIQAMKGTGPLSDAEGSRVTAAATRLTNATMSDDDARAAAKDFEAKLIRYQTALQQDIESSRRAEIARRQQMQAMMGAAAAAPAAAAPSASTASDDELRAMLGL